MSDSRKKYTISRRSFVKVSVAAALAPMVVPGRVLGKDGGVAPSNRITIGHIATGGQAQGLLRNAIEQPDTQILALCDVNTPKVEGVKRTVDATYENTDCKTYKDFRELIARDDIDACIIAPPDHWHAIPCIHAANAGKDIYCEKPLTHTFEEGRAVVDAAQRNGIIFQVGSMQRADGRFKRACEMVRNGHLGKIQHINVGLPDGGHAKHVTEFPEPPEGLDYDFWVGPTEWFPYHPDRLDWNWRWWMSTGGGQFMDWIGHHGDIAHMGMDWDDIGPKTIEPKIWDLPQDSNLYNAPSQYLAEYTYPDGTTMTVGSVQSMPDVFKQNGDTGTQFFGEDGQWVYVSRGKIVSNPEDLVRAPRRPSDFRFERQPNHMRDFLDCVKSRQQPLAPVEAGHHSAAIGHLGTIALMLGEKLEWDYTTEKFVGNDAANKMLGRPNRGEWSLA